MISLFYFIYNTISTTYEISLDKKVLNIYHDDASSFVTKDGVSSIASSVLLEEVIIHQGITEIQESAFYGFSKIISFELPNGLKYLYKFSLYGCSALRSLELPYGFIAIYSQALSGCKSLENLTLSSTVESITVDALDSCISIAHYFISGPNPIFSTDSTGRILIANGTIAIFGPAAFDTVKIPDQIKTINSFFLNKFMNVTTIDFGTAKNLTSIKTQAFRHTNIKRITYPEGLEYIGDLVLEGIAVEFISVPSTLQSQDGIFSSIPNDIYIHPECKCMYKADDGIIYSRDNTELLLIPNDISSIKISSKIKTINTRSITIRKNLSKLTVDPNNQYFSDYENALYNKTKYQFLASPGGLKVIKINSLCGNIQSYSLYQLDVEEILFEGPRSTSLIVEGLSLIDTKSQKPLIFPEKTVKFSSWAMTRFEAPSITFPSSLTTINYEAMLQLKVRKVNFSICEKVKSLPNKCFDSSLIEEILLPPKLERLETGVFQGSTKLKSIKVPSTVLSIGDSCFYNCKGLSSIEFLGESVSSIGTSAFKSCNLTNIKFPKKVGKLSMEVFSSNPNLKSIIFSTDSELTEIQLGVFRDSDSIESIHLPSKVKSITNGAFYGMGGLQNITIDQTNQYFESNDGVLYSKGLKELVAFPGGRRIYDIHKSVRIFRANAFFMCKKLEEVVYEGSVVLESIKEQTFLECERFASIMIPGSVSSIEGLSFSGCTSLETVSFGDGSLVKKIVSTTFSNCKSLKSVFFGSSATLEEIDEGVFSGLTKLQLFETPHSLRRIGKKAFSGCTNLNSFYLYNTSEILENAFEGCSQLKEIFLGPNLTKLGEMSFGKCNELKKVTYCGQNTFTDAAFEESKQLHSAIVPQTYGIDTFGGISIVRILDSDCHLPTFVFTAVGNSYIALPLVWSNIALSSTEA